MDDLTQPNLLAPSILCLTENCSGTPSSAENECSWVLHCPLETHRRTQPLHVEQYFPSNQWPHAFLWSLLFRPPSTIRQEQLAMLRLDVTSVGTYIRRTHKERQKRNAADDANGKSMVEVQSMVYIVGLVQSCYSVQTNENLNSLHTGGWSLGFGLSDETSRP
jgi:hypothetical protein